MLLPLQLLANLIPIERTVARGGGGGGRAGYAGIMRSRKLDEWVDAAVVKLEARDQPVERVTQTAVRKVAAIVRRDEDRTVTLEQIREALARVLAMYEDDEEEAVTMLMLS